MKTIYLIRHSAPFVEIENYEDYKNVNWYDYNKNMILSVKGEENAKKLCDIEEFKNIDAVYSSNSFRAIGTAKYIAEQNNLKIILDNRIDERELGISKIADLPDNFTIDSFNNRDLSIGFGESLNTVDRRFNRFIEFVLKTDKSNIALFIHGIILMSYLQTISKFDFDGQILDIEFKNKTIYKDKVKNPLIFKLEFDDNNNLINLENINND